MHYINYNYIDIVSLVGSLRLVHFWKFVMEIALSHEKSWKFTWSLKILKKSGKSGDAVLKF